jgi:hypothetical protein
VKVFHITETITYEIQASSEDEAARIFMESPNPAEFLVAIEDRSIEELVEPTPFDPINIKDLG